MSEAPDLPAAEPAQLALARADAALVAMTALFELLQGDHQLLKLFNERAAHASSALETRSASPVIREAFEQQIALLREALTRPGGPNPMEVDRPDHS